MIQVLMLNKLLTRKKTIFRFDDACGIFPRTLHLIFYGGTRGSIRLGMKTK